MKHFIIVLALCFSYIGFAQDSTKVKVETPKIISKLKYGKSVVFDDVEVKFVSLISDSRCPKNVSCVWGGEVVIMVDVLKGGKHLESKKMTFNAIGKGSDIYISEGLTITGMNVSPQPIQRQKIALEDYKMQLYIKN